MNLTIEQAVQVAGQHFKAGRFAEAEDVYRRILAVAPGAPEAHFNLGAILKMQKRFAEARESFHQCLKQVRDPVEYFKLLRSIITASVSGVGDGEGSRASDRAAEGPVTAEIELTSHCQLRCPFCRTGSALRAKYSDVPRGVMKRDTLERILAEIPSLFSISLYNWGEPFLHPDLPGMIELVRKSGKFCEISSNLQIMTPILAEAIIRSGLNIIRVSCDGATQDSYESYRKGGSLQKVLENARLLAGCGKRSFRGRAGRDSLALLTAVRDERCVATMFGRRACFRM